MGYEIPGNIDRERPLIGSGFGRRGGRARRCGLGADRRCQQDSYDEKCRGTRAYPPKRMVIPTIATPRSTMAMAILQGL